MTKAEKQKWLVIQEKKALDRAMKKLNAKGGALMLTKAEYLAYENYADMERKKVADSMSATKQQDIPNVEEVASTTLTMRLPKVIADSLTKEDILTALNDFVHAYKRAEEMQNAKEEVPKTFLQRAEALIKGDRQKDYGDKLANFAHIAMFFQAVLAPKLSPGNYISPEEVGMMMQGVKMARMIKSPDHADSILDNAGYAGCIGELQAERLALKTPTGAIHDSNSWMIPNVGN